ncbi:MAG: tRNA lysidine(34) synthetase TilS [Eudoraea sp.]
MLHLLRTHIINDFPELLEGKFLVACSGGIDSVVLVNLLARLNLDFVIAHCNFQLRGYESDLDAYFVEDLARKVNRKAIIKDFNAEAHAEEKRLSIQLAARELRYQWFAKLLDQYQLIKLVTAHQSDDNLETFLINLSRGTGLDGLTGIPERNAFLSRPLLPFSRDDIMAYAQKEHLQWREDLSNEEDKYLRNKIRHDVVPALKDLHPSFLRNYETTRKYLQESSSLILDYKERLKKELFVEENGLFKISIEALSAYNPLKAYLYILFKDYGFKQWNDVENLLKASSGKSIYSNTHRLIKDRDIVILERISIQDNEEWVIPLEKADISLPLSLRISFVEKMDSYAKNILYVDKETLEENLVLRKYKKGDYFYPFGMKGKKKISKFFKDQKYNMIEKENQWLLCSGNNIIWVIGKRPDERFKVTQKTKTIVKIIANL